MRAEGIGRVFVRVTRISILASRISLFLALDYANESLVVSQGKGQGQERKHEMNSLPCTKGSMNKCHTQPICQQKPTKNPRIIFMFIAVFGSKY